MRALRWAAAGLLGLLAGLLGLVGLILCATLILLPVGLPVLFLAKRLFRTAGQLMVPRAVRHPLKEADRRRSRATSLARRRGGKAASDATVAASKGARRLRSASSAVASKVPVPAKRSRTQRVRRRLHLA